MPAKNLVPVFVRALDPDTGSETLTPFGKCHPGQIRLLQKRGLTKKESGKVILDLTPDDGIHLVPENPSPPVRDSREEALAALRATLVALDGAVEDPESVEDYIRLTELVEDLENACFDFAGPANRLTSFTVDPDDGVGVEHHRVPVAENQTEDPSVWFTEIAERRKAGHRLLPADKNHLRICGFVDCDMGEAWHIPAHAVWPLTEADTEPLRDLGLDHETVLELIVTPEGRQTLLGPLVSSEEEPAVDPDLDLDTPFWQGVFDGLSEGLETPKDPPADSVRHMLGTQVPSLPYSIYDGMVDTPPLRDPKSFTIICEEN